MKLCRLSEADLSRVKPSEKQDSCSENSSDEIEELPAWISKKIDKSDENVTTLSETKAPDNELCMCELCGEILEHAALKAHECREMKLNMSSE